MENWNPFGWLLLGGGFLFGMIVGGPQAWLISYTVILAGLTILLTNLIRTLWQFVRSRK
jgi:hypothetical protein